MIRCMGGKRLKNLGDPDERITFPNFDEAIVDVGEVSVGHVVQQPGFRWSTDVKPIVGGDWCQARHVGVLISGRLGIELADGAAFEIGPMDAYDIPPGHDGFVVGHEPAVAIEWTGLRSIAGPRSVGGRVLVTILLTDIVESTEAAQRLGDVRWNDQLKAHYLGVRNQLERYRGREVKATGDGVLATFDSPVAALQCAAAVRAEAAEHGIEIRAGVHVGEVDMSGEDVHGLAVHEAARVMAKAGPGEVLASEVAKALATAGGMRFEDRGTHQLKGLAGERRLYAYVA